MRGRGAMRLCGAAVSAAFLVSMWTACASGGASAALWAGSFLAGPWQALQAAASLAAPASDAAPALSQAGTGGALPADVLLEDIPLETPAPTPAQAVADSVPLSDEEAPAGAGAVAETTYAQGSGTIYIPAGAGTIRNNTKESAAVIQEAVNAGLPFSVEPGSSEPQVLILHTHATETYRLHTGLWYAPDDTARSTDTAVNTCAVGAVMAQVLNDAGICTLHDETLNDYPSYTGSYANSRAVAQQYLAQYPSIRVILDVHRDAIESNGVRMAPVCTVNGRQAAQVMIICGADNGTTVPLPNCHENLRFAAAWEAAMEAHAPGLTRPVLYSYRYYNQDLSVGALLIEIGGHGNTLNEALYAGRLAAESLAALLGGTV